MKTTMKNKLVSFVLTFMMVLSLSSVAFAKEYNYKVTPSKTYNGYFKSSFNLNELEQKSVFFTCPEDGYLSIQAEHRVDTSSGYTYVLIRENGNQHTNNDLNVKDRRGEDRYSFFFKKGHKYEIVVQAKRGNGKRVVKLDRPRDISSILNRKGREYRVGDGYTQYKFIPKTSTLKLKCDMRNLDKTVEMQMFEADVEYPYYSFIKENLRKGNIRNVTIDNLTPGKVYYLEFHNRNNDSLEIESY